MAHCPQCGRTTNRPVLCKACDPTGAVTAAAAAQKGAAAAHVILTTAPSIEGRPVSETLDIVTAECVFGMNMFRDFFSGISDVFGGRSGTTQRGLREARKACLAELRREAADIGADAVIAVDLDYSELSGQGKSMLFLVASGTAVRLRQVESERQV